MRLTLTRAAASILAFTLPFTVIAAGVLTMDDSIAGLGLDIAVRSAKPSSAVQVTVQDPDGGTLTIPVMTNARGEGTATLPGTKTEAAGTYVARAADMQEDNATVEPDTMDPRTSVIRSWTPRISADGRDEAEITVALRDRYGNPLPGRPVALVSNRTADIVESLTPETDDEGVQHFAVTTDEPGVIQLRAIDLLSGNAVIEAAEVRAEGYAMGGYQNGAAYAAAPAYVSDRAYETSGKRFYYNAQVIPGGGFGVLDRFEVEVTPPALNTGEEASKVTIRAVDRNGQTVENYDGTVTFVTTDPNATVPNFGSYTFQERDLGQKTFALALTFRTPGQQTLRVEDRFDSSIFGEATIMVGGGGSVGTATIDVTSHEDDDYVNSLNIVLEGRGPRFANLIVTGGERDAFGTTDQNGAFSIPVTLNADQRDHTLRVQDDLRANDSGPIHLILDQVKPVIDQVTFAPSEPNEGEKVLVIVESEPGLQQVMLRLPDRVNGMVEEVLLSPLPTETGSYQGFFTAPPADVYQPAVTAMDRAGNVEEIRTQLNVGGMSLAKVDGLKAEPRVDAVELTWNPLPGELEAYRIYIGDSETNFLYTLDTGRVITKATVKGLTPGKTYYFAVTAIRGDLESEEKSDVVSAQVLGFNLEVKPQDSALNVTWTSLTTDLPLSSFVLAYGTDAENLNETRLLNGELRDFTIRDLLPGVEYVVSVTPVTVTGDTLEELAATGKGTPTGDGFTPSARDDVPFDIPRNPGGTLHPAPGNPSTGIPPLAWMSAAALGMGGVLYRWQRRRSVQRTEAFLQAVRRNYRQ